MNEDFLDFEDRMSFYLTNLGRMEYAIAASKHSATISETQLVPTITISKALNLVCIGVGIDLKKRIPIGIYIRCSEIFHRGPLKGREKYPGLWYLTPITPFPLKTELRDGFHIGYFPFDKMLKLC